jgi:hypothetical protein
LVPLGEKFDAADFETYIKENYGIQIHQADGSITDTYQIIDEKKYLVFFLKWL